MNNDAVGMFGRMIAPLKRRGLLLMAASAFIGLSMVAPKPVLAQDNYPSRPITFVIGFSTGGGIDLVGRLIASKMSEKLGQTVVVENRTGAGGNIGAHSVATAKPDGYTLYLGTNGTQAMNQFVFKDMPYDTDTAFANIAFVVRVANVLMINPKLPPQNMAEFIEYIKERPGQVRYGSGGVGTMSHLAMELLATQVGTKMVHVPYRGSGEQATDLLAGHIDAGFINIGNGITMAQSGQLRAIGVPSTSRWPALPDVPSISDYVPGFEAVSWYILQAPAKTDPAIVNKLNTVINEILADEGIRKDIEALGMEPVGGSIEDLNAFIKNETVKWKKIIADAGIVPQ